MHNARRWKMPSLFPPVLQEATGGDLPGLHGSDRNLRGADQSVADGEVCACMKDQYSGWSLCAHFPSILLLTASCMGQIWLLVLVPRRTYCWEP